MEKKLLIELPYLGNIAFYQLLTQFNEVYIERHEFFEKASFRNRCEIAGPNGKLVLSVPVVGGKDRRQYYREAKVAYEHTWLKDHWNSFCAGYRRSPYFEFYEDKFEAIFFNEYKYLFDLNWDLFQLIADLLKLNCQFHLTEKYEKKSAEGFNDSRSRFLPRRKEEIDLRYFQVFEDRTGYLSNLSIVDLLFNEGPNSLNVLKSVTHEK